MPKPVPQLESALASDVWEKPLVRHAIGMPEQILQAQEKWFYKIIPTLVLRLNLPWNLFNR
jgi:hypothetical protein